MKHARVDYDRIQDPEGKIPANEPVFLLRGQDKAAPKTVVFWAILAAMLGADGDITRAAFAQAEAMEQWQELHPAKIPDIPDISDTNKVPLRQDKDAACVFMIDPNGNVEFFDKFVLVGVGQKVDTVVDVGGLQVPMVMQALGECLKSLVKPLVNELAIRGAVVRLVGDTDVIHESGHMLGKDADGDNVS